MKYSEHMAVKVLLLANKSFDVRFIAEQINTVAFVFYESDQIDDFIKILKSETIDICYLQDAYFKTLDIQHHHLYELLQLKKYVFDVLIDNGKTNPSLSNSKLLEFKNRVNQVVQKKIHTNSLLSPRKKKIEEWEVFQKKINNEYPGFIEKLEREHTNLTVLNSRLCTYLRLGFTSKEISEKLNIQPESVKKSITRIKKKLKLPVTITLRSYLINL